MASCFTMDWHGSAILESVTAMFFPTLPSTVTIHRLPNGQYVHIQYYTPNIYYLLRKISIYNKIDDVRIMLYKIFFYPWPCIKWYEVFTDNYSF